MSVMDKFRLDGKVAVVTGGAGGIGRDSVEALAEVGAAVAVVDLPARSEDAADVAAYVARRTDRPVEAFACDVADEGDVDALVEAVVARFGTIDVLHNNAGTLHGSALDLEVDYPDWRRAVAVNLDSVFLLSRRVARVMSQHGHGGSIINTASMSGIVVNDTMNKTTTGSSYMTAKAGVIQLTRSLATQWAHLGIRVNAISPGYVDTALVHDFWTDEVIRWTTQRVPMQRYARPDELQGAIVFLASAASSYATGSNLVVDGGYTVW